MSSTRAMEELCGDSTLKNLVIMIDQQDEFTRRADARLRSDLSNPHGFVQAVVRRGAKIYRCTGASEPDLGALRIILGDRSVEDLRRELEEQKRRAEQEADAFKTHIARMRSEEANARKEMIREHHQKLEEQNRRAQEEAYDTFKKYTAEIVSREVEKQKQKAQEEADGLRKCIAELHSGIGDDRRGFGKTSATYNLRHLPANLRVFFVRSLTHLALQRIYPSTEDRKSVV